MNSLATWNPLRELDEIGRRFSRFFGQELPLDLRSTGTADGENNGGGLLPRAWNPAVDITENGHAYTIKADMPDVKKEDVRITVKNGVLELSGERKTEKDEKDGKQHRIERSYGRFLRTFTLPEDAEAEGIQAQCRDGVLTLTVPKSEQAQAKEIVVKIE